MILDGASFLLKRSAYKLLELRPGQEVYMGQVRGEAYYLRGFDIFILQLRNSDQNNLGTGPDAG